MTVSTLSARVMLAIDLAQKYSSIYFGIGQANPWDNNDTPPAESENTIAIANPIAYSRIQSATLCRPLQQNEAVPTDAIIWGGNTYVRVTEANAYKQGANSVYIEGTVAKSDITPNADVIYRTSGVYVGLVPKSGVTKPVLLPSDVANPGVLLSYTTITPVPTILNDETSMKLGALYTIARMEA